MTRDAAALYNAYASRDPRFDGVFYIGVTSTGIYCRPVCTAKTPKVANCRFFDSAEAAEKSNFRPCLRCRPELAPGNAPVDDAHRIASLIAHRIDEGMLDDGASIEQIAERFGSSWCRRDACCSPSSCSPRRRSPSPRSPTPADSRASVDSTTRSAAGTGCR